MLGGGRFTRISARLLLCVLIVQVLARPLAFGLGPGDDRRLPQPSPVAPNTPMLDWSPSIVQDHLEPDIHRQAPMSSRVPGGRALSEIVQPDRYRLGPGDGLTINIWGSVQMIYRIGVSADGKVTLPKVGDIPVAGSTLAKAGADIAAAVGGYYRNVKTSVSLSRLRTFQVLVLGAVNVPGIYLATPVSRVSELLDQAGGVRPDGSQRHIRVGRPGDPDSRHLDLMAFKRKGLVEQNPVIQDGDMIFVPTMGSIIVTVRWTKIKVLEKGVITEEPTQLAVELEEGERVQDLLTAIGGIDFAWDLERVQIVREQEAETATIAINMRKLFVEKDDNQNVQLQNGDLIVISPIVEKVFITGEVRNPGAYVYYPGKTIREYIGLAGGLTPRAEISRSHVESARGDRKPLDLNAKLSPGDSVVVSEVFFKWWQDYNTVAMSFLGVVLSGIAAMAAAGTFR